MARKLKVMTILGTRPEIIRLSACLKAFDAYFDHVLVHTGQNYDDCLNEVFFRDLNLRKPKYYLDCAGENLGETLGNILTASYRVLKEEQPDALLVLGDTNSALSAICAKRLKIPIFHMEAGNRCFDFNVPEEINRRLIDHIADINLPYTEHARRYLLAEGLPGSQIFVTGSPMPEVLAENHKKIENSHILETLGLADSEYFLVSAHREENIDKEENFFSLMEALNEVAETYELPVIYSIHPRSLNFVKQRNFVFHPLVTCMQPFGLLDYCSLQMHARCVLSDSGTLSEESSILGFPAVLLRTSTERPEVLEKAGMLLGGITKGDILQAIELSSVMAQKVTARQVADYKDKNISDKVVKLILSYTKIVNRNTWNKV